MTSWHPGNPRPPNFSDGPQAKKPASIVIYRHATIAPTGSNRSLAILMPQFERRCCSCWWCQTSFPSDCVQISTRRPLRHSLRSRASASEQPAPSASGESRSRISVLERLICRRRQRLGCFRGMSRDSPGASSLGPTRESSMSAHWTAGQQRGNSPKRVRNSPPNRPPCGLTSLGPDNDQGPGRPLAPLQWWVRTCGLHLVVTTGHATRQTQRVVRHLSLCLVWAATSSCSRGWPSCSRGWPETCW